MKSKNVNAVFHYVPLHSSPAGMRFGRLGSSMKNTDEYSARLLRLPLYYGLTDDTIQAVVASLYEFYDR